MFLDDEAYEWSAVLQKHMGRDKALQYMRALAKQDLRLVARAHRADPALGGRRATHRHRALGPHGARHESPRRAHRSSYSRSLLRSSQQTHAGAPGAPSRTPRRCFTTGRYQTKANRRSPALAAWSRAKASSSAFRNWWKRNRFLSTSISSARSWTRPAKSTARFFWGDSAPGAQAGSCPQRRRQRFPELMEKKSSTPMSSPSARLWRRQPRTSRRFFSDGELSSAGPNQRADVG